MDSFHQNLQPGASPGPIGIPGNLVSVLILTGCAFLVFLIIVLVWIWMMYKQSETHPPPAPRDIELQPLVRRGVPREDMRTFMSRLLLVRRGVPIEVREEVRTSIFQPNPLNSEERCPVCIEEFIEGDRLSALPPCSHIFHTDCIDVHMEMHTFCPYCRQTISLPYNTHV